MNVTTEEEKWLWVGAVRSLSWPLSMACGLFALLALAGYLAHIQVLYRPLTGGPATNPLTALSILLISLGIVANGRSRRYVGIERGFALVAAAIVILRLGDALFGSNLSLSITPFHDRVLLDLANGKSNSMGVNTACMLLFITAALGLHSFNRPAWSQVVASVAIAIPSVSFIGYGYGLLQFYGKMSLLTATAGFGLGAATLAMTADRAALEAILSPYIGGKIARMQILVGYLIPIALGYILVKSLVTGAQQGENLYGVFVVAICWFIVVMVSISAIFQEKTDLARRLIEGKLVAAAMNDPLTGLPNRRSFFESAQRIERSGTDVWVLMIDLDHFKHINDTAGHATGDRVLMDVASQMSQRVRDADIVARMGGEEFAVLLVDTSQAECEQVAENIRQHIESLQVPGWTSIHGPVTISIGYAKFNGVDTLEKALQAADAALYRAKRNGRNQVSH